MSYPSLADLELSIPNLDDYPSTRVESNNRGTNRFATTWSIHDIELSSGRIDADAEKVFTSGHCHAFALAVCALIPEARPVICADADHIAAELPDGRWIDVSGQRAPCDRPLRDVAAYDVSDWLEDGYKLPRVEDALPFAESLLRDLDIDF